MLLTDVQRQQRSFPKRRGSSTYDSDVKVSFTGTLIFIPVFDNSGELMWPSGLGDWIGNLEVPSSNPPTLPLSGQPPSSWNS